MSKKSTLVNRRALFAACVAVPTVVATGGAASAAPVTSEKVTIPAGNRRGVVVDTEDDGTKIYEVLDRSGKVVGYTFDDNALSELSIAGKALGEEETLDGSLEVEAQAGGATDVAACAAGVSAFVVMTVFPAARVAKLAWRLGKLTKKYGPKLVARIFKGARGVAGRTAEKEIIQLGKELTGIAALKACGL